MPEVTRRTLLAGGAGCVAAMALPRAVYGAASTRTLVAACRWSAPLSEDAALPLDLRCYDGTVPGPLLRYRVGDRLDVTFVNRLPEPSSVQWRGMPITGAGAQTELAQPPAAPGASMRYAFDLTKPGTFWYHSHSRDANRLDRGLYGVVIVDEADPPPVDQNVVLVFDDCDVGAAQTSRRTSRNLARPPRPDVFACDDLGRTVIPVTSGERLRLRLINVARAQAFALAFDAHDPWVIARDGDGVLPRRMGDEPLLLGSGRRVDLLLDALGEPGSVHAFGTSTVACAGSLGALAYRHGRRRSIVH